MQDLKVVNVQSATAIKHTYTLPGVRPVIRFRPIGLYVEDHKIRIVVARGCSFAKRDTLASLEFSRLCPPIRAMEFYTLFTQRADILNDLDPGDDPGVDTADVSHGDASSQASHDLSRGKWPYSSILFVLTNVYCDVGRVRRPRYFPIDLLWHLTQFLGWPPGQWRRSYAQQWDVERRRIRTILA